eukprot:CAMPEP_0206385636 /NCGR_PEP_ID=MMETSP0294-20121207/15406_1 /ASSEMBLY_ACC=CAM_ASM_000327 /TAXON_ID=39354 /ORGANISM="Heterosigma akashiwo, Strain CCMP2393" /LENGTH=185 /DNA_ID=CAMNT_0053836411 /DNA_START=115 /DNA_END=669 /DNA_ORIENTATION=+
MAPRVTAALFVCLVLPCYLISLVQGTIAHPEPQVYRAEDGTELKLKLKGDGFHHWLEDQNGHAVVKDGEEYYYAHGIDTEGELVHSGEKVKDHQLDPSSVGIPKVNKLRGRPRRGQKRRSKRRALSLAPGAGEARRGGAAAAAADSQWASVELKQPSRTLVGLHPGTSVEVRVRARTAGGWSDWS